MQEFAGTRIPDGDRVAMQSAHARRDRRRRMKKPLNTMFICSFLLLCGLAKAEQPREMARQLSSVGRFEEAYELLEEAILEAASEQAEHRIISTMVQLTNHPEGREARIVAFLNHAANVEPHLWADNRAYLVFHMGKRQAMLGDYRASSDLLREAAEKLPRSRWTWSMRYQVGANHYLQGDYEAARRHFAQLEEKFPAPRERQARTLGVQMISTLFQLGDWPAVIERAEPLQARMDDGPSKLAMLDQLASSYYHLGDRSSAARVYGEYLSLHESLRPEPTQFQRLKRQQARQRQEECLLGDMLFREMADVQDELRSAAIAEASGIGTSGRSDEAGGRSPTDGEHPPMHNASPSTRATESSSPDRGAAGYALPVGLMALLAVIGVVYLLNRRRRRKA